MARLARTLGAGFAGLSSLAILGLPAAHTQAPETVFDDADRRAVVEAAAEALRSRYVFPDVAERAAAAIETALATGSYDDIESPWSFAERLTGDLQEVAKDKHLRVSAPGPAPAASGGAERPPPRSEGGVTRADRLSGHIGYIEIAGFPSLDMFRRAVDRAMAPLEDTHALIIDARRNGGGSPQSVSYLVSYFLDAGAEPVKINEFIWRNRGTETFRTEEFWSTPTPFSYAGKPVYVLTSERTFSGGEEFAYDMKVMGLGTVVGETTGGGANPGGSVQLASGLRMFVPGGRARNPITGTNWEGVGVTPDVDVPSADALKVALERLGQAPGQRDIDALSEGRKFEVRTMPVAGSEAAVRRMIDELVRGEPDYNLLSESMAHVTREQLPNLQQMFTELGPVESVTFVEVDPVGADVFDVQFARGSLTWVIVLTSDGKTAMANIRAAPE